MTSSGKKSGARTVAGRKPAVTAADWHALEVPVPEHGPLEAVAGGLPGREPPRANRLLESIAAAIAADAGGSIAAPTWLVAESRRIGNAWIETLARTGRPIANTHVTTVSALAYDIAAEALASEGLGLAPPRAKRAAVERVLHEQRDALRVYGVAAGSPRRLAEQLVHSLDALRNAGISPRDVERSLRRSAKGHDLALLLERYTATLREMKLVDQAGEVSLAVERVRAGGVPPTMTRLLVPDDLDVPRLERDLLAVLRATPGVVVTTLATDPPPAETGGAEGDRRFTIFRAAGEANEVRHVIRTCVRRGLRFDEVEIVHTDPTTYPALVRELVAALPLPSGSATAAGSEPNLPVTFAEGLPLAHSRPGRAVTAWLAWRRDGHPQSGLEAMLRDGLLTLDTVAPDAPRPAGLVRELRGMRIGRGLDRSRSLLTAAAARASEQPAEAFARGRPDESADDESVDRECLHARKQQHCQRLEALRLLVDRLAACEAGPAATAADVLAGSRDFVENLCPHDSELDGNARRVILDEIAAMETWGAVPGAASGRDMLDWLERLPATLVVLGSGPRPGCLHVSGLAGGGHAGRPYTFVLGLDENRFPGAGSTDPVLTDGDRTLLNAVRPDAGLTVARDTAARNLDRWRRLLGRLRGEVWLGFSCRDTAEDVEVFPSPALAALHGRAVGKPLATVADLLGALPPPETLVPRHPDGALDESQWWLATLGPEASAGQMRRAVAAHRDHLALGQVAIAARNSSNVTPHDGLVPSAGPLLDPCAERGRTASPKSLEILGTCPRRFFFRHALGVEPPVDFDDDADRWLNAIDAGSLLHTVLERFMGRVIERHELPAVDSHLAELLTILDNELAAIRHRHPPLTELSFHTRRVELQTAMRTFLHEEERCCRERGLRPLAIEVAIGLEPAGAGTPFDCPEAVVVPLAPGETIRLRGRIDRIDVREAGGGGAAYALWDYKSGSGYGFPAPGPGDPFLGGRTLQHGLYVVMLQARLAAPDCSLTGTVERFGYFFPTRMGKGRRLEWTRDELADCTGLVRRLAEIARRGAFVPTTNPADCDRCDFARACGDTARVTRDTARKLAQSEALRPLFADLRDRRPPAAAEPRRPHPRALVATPHPDVPGTPPDEAVRRRIREDLGTTLLVEAAAGTGKTTCMVDRMLALVRSGTAKPEGIVAVTFTKKAAGELRRRFREAVQAAWAAAADDTERSRLAAALDRLDSMMIGTIHSFAGRLLRERPIEAGVDPGFRELDDPADRLLRRRAWREFVTAAPTDHVALLDRLDAVGLRLADLSRLFIDRFASYGDVEAWPAPETPPPDVTAVVASLEAFVARVETEVFPPPAERGSDELMTALEQVARMFRRCDRASTSAVMELVEEFDRAPKVTQSSWPGAGGTEAEARAARKAAALGWQEAWEAFREQVAQPALWSWRAHRYPPAITALEAARDCYDRLRTERGVLSFQDLLCRAATLLAHDPEVRQGFRGRYTHVLVDEFQDTDPVQAQLLVLLTATDPTETDWRRCQPVPGSLFVVGDPKQSLYRFRRADIVTYATVRELVERHGDVLSLTTNFRSRADLVEWVNGVFRTEFPPSATPESPSFTASTSGRMEPRPAAAGGRDWLTGVRTLRLVRAGQAGVAWAQREAREIAAFIRGAIDARMAVPRTVNEVAAGVESACRPGDFLIVTPERRHLGVYAAALHEVGLPVDVTGTLGEQQTDPLRDLRSCLAVLADPDDAVAVLALLRGPLFGFSDADLFDYKATGGRFGGTIDVPSRLDADLRHRFATARDTLLRWQTWTRHLPVAATVERVIDDAGLMLLAAADGAAGHRGRAVAGLFQTYLEEVRASRLEVTSIADCLDLLDDMLDATARAGFDPLAIDVPSTDRVRVMNLHKAKGLEAAVVFLADYQRREAGDTPAAGPFLHIDRSRDRTEGWLAITTPFGRGQRIVAAPPDWPTRCGRERGFERAEQIRLDYVAATRAASCLVVSLFERHDPGTKSRPADFSAEGGWARFGPHLAAAADLPEPATALPRAVAADDASPTVDRGQLTGRIVDCLHASFARISPRELLTEPAEGIRFTGRGLGEPWGRAIHRLLERAADDPGLDLAAAAATALSHEDLSPGHVDRAVATVRSVMASGVWRRALASPSRHTELPFSVQVRGTGLPERVRRSAGIAGQPLPTVVRGVIDLVFLEPAGADSRGWTVVDWKTDSVSESSTAALADHYRPQVELYADCWRLLVDIHRSGVTP